MANQKAEIIISAKDQTKIAFASVKSSLSGIGGIAGGLNNTLGALAPVLGAASFTAFLKSGIDTLDMLGDLSDRTGVAASTLSGFQLVAAQSDTSLEALGKGINKLSIFMAENSEEAKKLGLSAKDPAEAFVQLANIISNIEDPQQRAGGHRPGRDPRVRPIALSLRRLRQLISCGASVPLVRHRPSAG